MNNNNNNIQTILPGYIELHYTLASPMSNPIFYSTQYISFLKNSNEFKKVSSLEKEDLINEILKLTDVKDSYIIDYKWMIYIDNSLLPTIYKQKMLPTWVELHCTLGTPSKEPKYCIKTCLYLNRKSVEFEKISNAPVNDVLKEILRVTQVQDSVVVNYKWMMTVNIDTLKSIIKFELKG